MIIDSHCHLAYQNNISKINQKITRALDNDVTHFLNICTKSDEFEILEDVSKNFNQVYFTLGIHPHESNETSFKIIEMIKKKSSNKSLVGIGETGLDFFYNHSDKKTQINSLEMHIELSQELELPLIIHMRDAEDELIKIFSKRLKEKIFTGVIHCFTGTYKFSQVMLDMNFYISASGIITFKKSHELRDTFKKIPLDNLLVETDSPFLTPEPFRGKENEPAYIVNTIKKLSEIHGIDYKDLCNITTKNFKNLFKKVCEN